MKPLFLRKLFCCSSCLFTVVVLLTMQPLNAMAADHTIIVFDNYLAPDKINIHVGDTVIWTNSGSVPKIIEADATQGGCTESEALHVIIEPGQSYSHTFTEPKPCHYTVRDFSGPVSIKA